MDKSHLRLLPHDASWKDDFTQEKQRIEDELNDTSVRIEHVGSTSIPGIYAKPILDIAILCDAKNLDAVIAALIKLDYEYRGRYDEKDGHFYAVSERRNIRFGQAHIYTEANEDWNIKLKFRDVLSRNAKLASEYNDYKLNLAKRVKNKNEYAEIKSKWVDSFILKIL